MRSGETREGPTRTMTLEPCVNLRTLGYRITGVQRYLRNLLPHMPAELNSIKPSQALHGMKGHLWEQLYLPTQLRRRLLWIRLLWMMVKLHQRRFRVMRGDIPTSPHPVTCAQV